MNKKLSKVIVRLLVFVCFVIVGKINAQILTNGTTQPNITGQNPFIDVSTNFDPSVSNNNEGKGLVFPRTDLTTWVFKTELLDGINFPAAFDGMMVYNTGTGQTLAGQGIQAAVKPGFYYFFNPNGSTDITNGKWVSVSPNTTTNITLTSSTSPAGTSLGQVAYNTGSVQPTGLVYWDGTQWNAINTSNSIILTSSTSPAGVSIGQTAYNTGSVQPTGLVYWNGTQWVSVSNPNSVSLTNATSPAGTTIGQMVYNTNAASGLPVGPVYWDGTTWVAMVAGPQLGDIKSGFQTADHVGWIRLNGRLKSTLTATQQAQATALGIGTNLPDATDRVLKQKSTGVNTTGGSNTATILQTNLPNINLTTSTSGAHTHNVAANNNNGFGGGGANPRTLNGNDPIGTTSAGAHTHTVPLGGSGTALPVEDAYLSVNMFIYLGN